MENKPQMLDALEFARPRCPPPGLVIDVGANGGRETEQARHAGYEVVSVECLTREYMKLQERWKDERRITLLNGCASDSLTLQRFSEAGAGSSLHPEAVSRDEELKNFRKNKERVTNVITFPLDPLIESREQQPVCVVKIDTQGHEISVMRGVERTIRKHKPVVIIVCVGIGVNHIETSLQHVKPKAAEREEGAERGAGTRYREGGGREGGRWHGSLTRTQAATGILARHAVHKPCCPR